MLKFNKSVYIVSRICIQEFSKQLVLARTYRSILCALSMLSLWLSILSYNLQNSCTYLAYIIFSGGTWLHICWASVSITAFSICQKVWRHRSWGMPKNNWLSRIEDTLDHSSYSAAFVVLIVLLLVDNLFISVSIIVSCWNNCLMITTMN